MEVHFTPEQEAQLLEEDMNFRAATQRGIEQADRGELLEHIEVKSRIERLLQY
jgi:predicted transcriptional regulator